MRILVLCKRQYTGKDLLDDRYGRLFELPAQLAAAGHEISGVALSYRRRGNGRWTWDDRPRLSWHSVDLELPGWRGLLNYRKFVTGTIAGFRPHVIWASSDVYQVIHALHLARRHDLPVVLDLYDQYESFAASRVPGVHTAYRAACRRADGLTVVSSMLADWVARHCDRDDAVVLRNAVRTDLFHRQDRLAARRELGLPQDERLIGTAGALVGSRGIGDLLRAFERLAVQDPRLWLVLAGPRDACVRDFRHPRLIDLGEIAHERVPRLLAALDVGVVCNRDTAFGRFCDPLKLAELVACGTTFVAAGVGEVARLLASEPGFLYPPGDVTTLAGRISGCLQADARLPPSGLQVADWAARARELAAVLQAVATAVGVRH